MDEMCYIVATKHSGSLKGEHGTGRNVAPYVEMEWGEAQATPQHVAWYPACLHVPGLACSFDPDRFSVQAPRRTS